MLHGRRASMVAAGLLGSLACGGGPDDGSQYTEGVADEAESSSSDESSSTSSSSSSSSSDDSSSTSTDESESSTSETGSDESETSQACALDADCAGSPAGELCNPDTGLCVLCLPASVQSCYTGEGGLDVGPCLAGEQACLADGTAFGPCEGEVVPTTELCGDLIDQDCNGVVDDNLDLDQDGWGACDGDCCDILSGNCSDPELVNPGAYEVLGNSVDDDCDGMEDEPAQACDAGLAESSTDPDDFAMAIELCQFTSANPPLPDKVWGVLDAIVKLPNGSPLAHWEQVGLPSNYGPNLPTANDAMVVLSSGWASDTAASAEWGKGWSVVQQAPAAWTMHHGGYLPKNPGCGNNGSTIRDPVMLELTIRAPTNALSFNLDLDFFNAEYPEWVCGQYQDMFVALIDSESDLNPADSNIAIFDDGMGGQYPIGVNLARDSGLFRQCAPSSDFGCQGSGGVQAALACEGVDQLVGTPYGANDPGCNDEHHYSGGATGWLTLHGNVVPGEVFVLRLFVFDAGEGGSGLADALVLLDDWQWELEASAPGVEPQ
ncbi:MopE-related protein [Nannocystaceae bacterium ST9]